jgi:hypothetical protein
VTAHLVLAVIAVLAARVGFLYLAPFGPCPKCKGTGHIKRGPRRRPVCPRCKGRRRIQRTGSRTVHRARPEDPRRAASRRPLPAGGQRWDTLTAHTPTAAAAVGLGRPCSWSWPPLAVKLAGPVLSAVSELVQMVLIAAAVIVGVGAAGLVGLLTWRWRRTLTDAARAMPPDPGAVSPLHGVARAAPPLPEPRPALGRPQEVHLHLHGVTPADIADILARENLPQDRK